MSENGIYIYMLIHLHTRYAFDSISRHCSSLHQSETEAVYILFINLRARFELFSVCVHCFTCAIPVSKMTNCFGVCYKTIVLHQELSSDVTEQAD